MGQTECGPSIAKDGLRSSAHPIHYNIGIVVVRNNTKQRKNANSINDSMQENSL